MDAAQSYVDLTVNGMFMRCHLHDNHTETDLAVGGGALNGHELTLFLDHVKPGSVVVDIGANAGLYTLLAARKAGPGGRVLAIEPNRTMVGRLKFNIAHNDIHNVSLAICAVGETTTERTLNIVHNNAGAASLATFDFPVAITPQQVAVRPLLTVVNDMRLDRIDVMKVDVEGYEDRVLLPFFEAARRALWPKVILMEIGHAKAWTFDCVAELAKFGYRETWRNERDCLLEWNS